MKTATSTTKRASRLHPHDFIVVHRDDPPTRVTFYSESAEQALKLAQSWAKNLGGITVEPV